MNSVFFAMSNLMQAKKSRSASWDDVTKFLGILQHVINLLLLKIICCLYKTINTNSQFYF